MAKPNPTGRVDILLSSMLERQVKQMGDPIIQAMHQTLKPDIDLVMRQRFGPRSEVTKKARKLLRRLAGPRPPIGVRKARTTKPKNSKRTPVA